MILLKASLIDIDLFLWITIKKISLKFNDFDFRQSLKSVHIIFYNFYISIQKYNACIIPIESSLRSGIHMYLRIQKQNFKNVQKKV